MTGWRSSREDGRRIDAEIARWDSRVDAWAAARGWSLAPEPAAEVRTWGDSMEVEGALVWTDDG